MNVTSWGLVGSSIILACLLIYVTVSYAAPVKMKGRQVVHINKAEVIEIMKYWEM